MLFKLLCLHLIGQIRVGFILSPGNTENPACETLCSLNQKMMIEIMQYICQLNCCHNLPIEISKIDSSGLCPHIQGYRIHF